MSRFSRVVRYHVRGEGGVALLELGIILPVIVLIFLTAIEFTNVFNIKEQTKLYSRLAADTAHRRCLTEENLDTTQASYPAQLTDCLQQVARNTWEPSALVFKDVAISIAVYSFDGTTVSRVATKGWRAASLSAEGEPFDPAFADETTLFNAAEVEARFLPAISATNTLVIGEIFCTRSPLLKMISDRFYSAAIS